MFRLWETLRLLLVNFRSILNKGIEFWNLVDSHVSDIIIATAETWLDEQITNAEIIRADFNFIEFYSTDGCILIGVKRELSSYLILSDQFEELIYFQIHGVTENIHLIRCYRQPDERNYLLLWRLDQLVRCSNSKGLKFTECKLAR